MGMLYTALWYYPVIMVGAGMVTLVWDSGWCHRGYGYLRDKMRILIIRGREWREREAKKEKDIEVGSNASEDWTTATSSTTAVAAEDANHPPLDLSEKQIQQQQHLVARPTPTTPTSESNSGSDRSRPPSIAPSSSSTATSLTPPCSFPPMSLRLALLILALFLLSFTTIVLTHSLIPSTPRLYSLFSVLYLAGTIIFGGGPVVIPLLRDYIVTPGWVTPRDFLLGLAIIQAFPGPNFNFAVYLGGLAVGSSYSSGLVGQQQQQQSGAGGTAGGGGQSALGALLAFLAIFSPGLIIVIGFVGLWRVLRCKSWFLSLLRGVNAAAVGLVFTAVYKLWQIGDLTASASASTSGGGGQQQQGAGGGNSGGKPLGTDPWLVAITATAFVGVAWFRVEPPVAILVGGAMGVGRWAVVR